MRKSTTGRRVPRKIGGDEGDEENTQTSEIKRPLFKPRKSTSRKSLGPTSVDDEEEDPAESVVTPKRSGLSRVAIQRNASKRSSLVASQLSRRSSEEDDDDRPSYSAAALRELKDSTPATPQNLGTVEDVAIGTQALDLSSKFGASLARYDQSSGQSSAIPSATEIAEKKARRARLAKEEAAEYIFLDPDDPDLDDDEDLDDNVMRNERGQLVLKPKDKYGHSESRLVHEDEDIMENFDEFTEDGKISLGRKAEVEAARKRKQDMAAQIAEAEGATDDDSDDSERARTDAFVANQTRHGTYTQTSADLDSTNQRPRTPPIITPLSTLDNVVERLRSQLAGMQTSRMQKLQEMESLQREKVHLAEQEVRIQSALKETAEKFVALRKEQGIDAEAKTDQLAIEAPLGAATNGDSSVARDTDMAEADDEEEEDEEEERPAFGGLGLGAGRPNLAGFGLGFQAARDDEDET